MRVVKQAASSTLADSISSASWVLGTCSVQISRLDSMLDTPTLKGQAYDAARDRERYVIKPALQALFAATEMFSTACTQDKDWIHSLPESSPGACDTAEFESQIQQTESLLQSARDSKSRLDRIIQMLQWEDGSADLLYSKQQWAYYYGELAQKYERTKQLLKGKLDEALRYESEAAGLYADAESLCSEVLAEARSALQTGTYLAGGMQWISNAEAAYHASLQRRIVNRVFPSGQLNTTELRKLFNKEALTQDELAALESVIRQLAESGDREGLETFISQGMIATGLRPNLEKVLIKYFDGVTNGGIEPKGREVLDALARFSRVEGGSREIEIILLDGKITYEAEGSLELLDNPAGIDLDAIADPNKGRYGAGLKIGEIEASFSNDRSFEVSMGDNKVEVDRSTGEMTVESRAYEYEATDSEGVAWVKFPEATFTAPLGATVTLTTSVGVKLSETSSDDISVSKGALLIRQKRKTEVGESYAEETLTLEKRLNDSDLQEEACINYLVEPEAAEITARELWLDLIPNPSAFTSVLKNPAPRWEVPTLLLMTFGGYYYLQTVAAGALGVPSVYYVPEGAVTDLPTSI